MKTIIIGFSRRKDFNIFSKLICLVTKSQVSHVYIRIPIPEYEDNMIFQASGLIVNYENYKLFLEKELVIEEYEIPITDEQFIVSEKFRITEAGKPYSLKEIFGMLWILFMRQFGKQVNNPFSTGNNAYICVDIGVDQIGYNESGNLTPEDFRVWLRQKYKPSYTILL